MVAMAQSKANSQGTSLVPAAAGAVAIPTLLGRSAMRIPVGGRIRAGIKVLTRRAAESARAREVYEAGVAEGRGFDAIPGLDDLDGAARVRLAADGPIAYAVEPDPSGAAAPGGLRLRLYGVQPDASLAQQSGAPFVVQATASGHDTVLQVEAPGLGSRRLSVGTAGRATELVIVVR